MVCRNPLLADERARKRGELLAATEAKLEALAEATRRPKRALRGKDRIGVRLGRILAKSKMGKHFVVEIGETSFAYRRDEAKIAAEAALDGIYVVRTSVESGALGGEEAVRAYKDLGRVERAFRCLKTVDLHVRPIHHRLDGRIRAHVFLCMLAYYLEWHLRGELAPVLFDDHRRAEAESERASVVARAPRSAAAKAKDTLKRTGEGWPVQSLRTLLADLGTVARNTVRVPGSEEAVEVVTTPTEFQRHVFELAKVRL